MRKDEVAYWNSEFKVVGCKFSDRPWKRQQQMRRILCHDLFGKTILEIGVGHGVVALGLQTVMCGTVNYLGTEISSDAVKRLQDMDLNVVQADVGKIPLPSSKVDIVLALDSLEHVDPADRDRGYAEIDRILAPSGLIMIHLPRSKTRHNLKYDHGFTGKDLDELVSATNTNIIINEEYNATHRSGTWEYWWIVLERTMK